ncbi:MAG: N-acetylmuramoyl-L-alanine amidase [Hyphomicrobiales bacterium]|nr:N-acetylmuramoyl-L-alanine amidase [Hyphomicrobiales bacterium]
MSPGPDKALDVLWRASPNCEQRRGGLRPTILLMHYTGMTRADRAVDWLCAPASRVSCHYLVDEDGRITQMVSEDARAWHAGVSCWMGETDINSASIGIEIHNPGHDAGYPDFPEAQMDAVIALSRDILTRHDIPPRRVLAHSDVAPDRKADPGEKFDWAGLARAGIGHWVPPAPLAAKAPEHAGLEPETVRHTQQLLAYYGYDCPVNGTVCARTERVVRAFQRHFRQSLADGRIDRSTIDTLERLAQ